MSKVTAIILAAGESRRMAQPKMLLPFNGKTIIETVIDNLAGADIKSVLVVLGAENESIMQAVKAYKVRTCINEKYMEGMLSSVKCGFRNLTEECDFVLVCLGDQPMVRNSVINRVIKEALASGKGLAMPVYNGKRGHPLFISCRYREEILNLNPPDSLRTIIINHSEDILEVGTDDPSILRDLDTYDDYMKELNKTP